MARLRNKLTGVVVNVPTDSRPGYELVEDKPEPKKAPAKRQAKSDTDK